MQEPAPPPRIDAELLREFLTYRNAICPSCQYNLRGLTGERCPECAAVLALGVSATPPLSARARRGIAAFAWLIFASNLVALLSTVVWMVRYGGFAGMPPKYVVRQFISTGLDGGATFAAGTSLIVLAVSKRGRDDRYKGCLRVSVIICSCIFVWHIVSYILYLLF